MDLTNAHPSEVEFIQNSPSEMELHKTILNINGFIAVLINSVAVYIILKHSPSQIGTYKYHLLNIVLWSTFADVCTGLLFVPYNPYLPAGTCSLGPLSEFSDYRAQAILGAIIGWIGGVSGVTIIIAFIYRYMSLSDKAYLLHKPKSLFLIVLFHVGYILPNIIFFAFSYAAQARQGLCKEPNEKGAKLQGPGVGGDSSDIECPPDCYKLWADKPEE